MIISTEELDYATNAVDTLVDKIREDPLKVTVEDLAQIVLTRTHTSIQQHRELVCFMLAVAIKRLANA